MPLEGLFWPGAFEELPFPLPWPLPLSWPLALPLPLPGPPLLLSVPFDTAGVFSELPGADVPFCCPGADAELSAGCDVAAALPLSFPLPLPFPLSAYAPAASASASRRQVSAGRCFFCLLRAAPE